MGLEMGLGLSAVVTIIGRVLGPDAFLGASNYI